MRLMQAKREDVRQVRRVIFVDEPAEQTDGVAFRADGAFPLGAVLAVADPVPGTLALFFFCFAGVTDFLDGRIARARGLITNFGILMDPLADKLMVCSASSRLWKARICIPTRRSRSPRDGHHHRRARTDHHGLRLLAASKGVVLAAERFGKHKTISQIAAINRAAGDRRQKRMAVVLQNIFQGWSVPFTEIALWLTLC